MPEHVGTESVILVDEQDRDTGIMEKLRAHELGVLHRAFSVFLLNGKGEILLQQRAAEKYHSPGLWSNTCCSHPRPGEEVHDAARRRLREEMGLDCALQPLYRFVYRAAFGNGLTEHEYDHVFVGRCDDEPTLNPDEVQAWRYADIEHLRNELSDSPEQYSVWLALCFAEVAPLLQHFHQQNA